MGENSLFNCNRLHGDTCNKRDGMNMDIYRCNRSFSLLRVAALTLFSFVWISLGSSTLAESDTSHQKQILMIVGFDGNVWQPYTVSIPPKGPIQRHQWQKIEAIVNPMSVTRQPGTGIFFVKDNSGQLQYLAEDTQVFSPLLIQTENKELSGYTHLRAHGAGVTFVQLLMGKSKDTQLLHYTNKNQPDGSYTLLLEQASGQFHPLIDEKQKSLFYAHVSCRVACNPVIQEVWQQNLVTRQAQQLTLLNATSYLHSVDDSGNFGFISSNHHGRYHIARLNIKSKALIWLTSGQVTDTFPNIASNGDLYFIRRTPQGTSLTRLHDVMSLSDLADNHTLAPIVLPEGVQKIRYLEINRR